MFIHIYIYIYISIYTYIFAKGLVALTASLPLRLRSYEVAIQRRERRWVYADGVGFMAHGDTIFIGHMIDHILPMV